jgi:hypothetical protein
MAGGAPHCRAGALRPSQRLGTRPAHMLGWQGHGPDRPGKHRPSDPLTSVDVLCHHEDLLICDLIKDLYRFFEWQRRANMVTVHDQHGRVVSERIENSIQGAPRARRQWVVPTWERLETPMEVTMYAGRR